LVISAPLHRSSPVHRPWFAGTFEASKLERAVILGEDFREQIDGERRVPFLIFGIGTQGQVLHDLGYGLVVVFGEPISGK
jgi:hypothetical protein